MRHAWVKIGALLLALSPGALLGCSGEVGSGEGDGDGDTGFGPGASGAGAPGDGPAAGGPGAGGELPPQADPYSVGFDCDAAADPSTAPLSRLTMPQYENTLQALFEDVPGAMAAARAALDQLPIDGEDDESFSDMDGRISQRHIDGFVQVAAAIAGHVVAEPARLSALAGDCATAASLDPACLRSFIEDFGRLVHRRPLGDAQLARYQELAEGVDAHEAYRGVLLSMLIAPAFLYHLEIDGAELDGRADLLALSPHELASRLSYHLWQAPPDAQLRAAADDGSLMDDDVYAAQVERLHDDPRALQSVVRFFGQWYRLDIFGGFATTPAFETFADGLRADRALYDAAVDEVEALVRYHVESGNYRDLLDSELSFARDPVLAELYGVSPWDGASEPASFPEGERAGVLSRMAMLVSSNHTTNPFKRGAFIQREILCQPVEPPANLPPDALAPPPFDPDASTRERFEAKVQSPTCAGCHATFTPFGMALEAYDGLGRLRSDETLIDDAGELVGSVPVDTRVTALIDGQSQELDGPVALARALADSERASECFARHYFRYSFRRVEQPGDECVLASMLQSVGPGGSLRDALRQVALDPAFKRRSWR